MSSIYDWQKQLDAINRTTNMYNSISNQMEAINRLGNITSALAMSNSHLNALSGVNNSAILSSNALMKQYDTYKILQGVDFSKLFAMQDSVQKMIANYNFSSFASALGSFSKIDYSNSIVNASSALKMYDVSKFSSAIQNTLSGLDWNNTINVTDIIEEVTEQYIEENELDESVSEEIREVVSAKQGMVLTEQQRKIWEVYVYPFLVSLFFFIIGLKQQQHPAVINNIMEVNNYYTIEVGMEVDTLNSYNFRIIGKNDVMVRIKPDCSSRVVGHLSLGKVVCIVDKYKKWIEITWKNDEGQYYSGWIQNYKVSKFK